MLYIFKMDSGLVSPVYSREHLGEQALKQAHRIGRNAPIAVRCMKEAINDGLEKELDQALALEAERFADCFEIEN